VNKINASSVTARTTVDQPSSPLVLQQYEDAADIPSLLGYSLTKWLVL